MVTRGFTGRQSGSEPSDRIPPGQHLVDNFPVLTAGPTPRIDPADWTFTLKVGPVAEKIEVSGEQAPLVESADSAVSGRRVVRLPVGLQRRPAQLTQPAAVSVSRSSGTGPLNTNSNTNRIPGTIHTNRAARCISFALLLIPATNVGIRLKTNK